jgi:hypothetical protein
VTSPPVTLSRQDACLPVRSETTSRVTGSRACLAAQQLAGFPESSSLHDDFVLCCVFLSLAVPGHLSSAMTTLQGPLPPELWGTVLTFADHSTLKATRKVNTVFKDLSTPLLFDHAVCSLDEKTCRNLKLLSKSKLSKHVQRLYLDTALYTPNLDTRRYAQFSASFFRSEFDLPAQINGTPLSEQHLLKVLRADPIEDLGVKYLSGMSTRHSTSNWAKSYRCGTTSICCRIYHLCRPIGSLQGAAPGRRPVQAPQRCHI